MQEGPLVEALTHRLSQCPRDFLDTPKYGKAGKIQVAAVVCDLITDLGGKFSNAKDAKVFSEVTKEDVNWLNIVLICCWLLHDSWFIKRQEFARPALALLKKGLKKLSKVVESKQFVLEADRREELVRHVLKALGVVPKGEKENQSEDRLSALDSVERARVVRDAKRAEEHAQKVREAMKKRKAKESAAKAIRE